MSLGICCLTFATCSSQRPREMKTRSMGGVSKKVMGEYGSCIAIAATTTDTEYTYETARFNYIVRGTLREQKRFAKASSNQMIF